jgi:hypothetical protein
MSFSRLRPNDIVHSFRVACIHAFDPRDPSKFLALQHTWNLYLAAWLELIHFRELWDLTVQALCKEASRYLMVRGGIDIPVVPAVEALLERVCPDDAQLEELRVIVSAMTYIPTQRELCKNVMYAIAEFRETSML